MLYFRLQQPLILSCLLAVLVVPGLASAKPIHSSAFPEYSTQQSAMESDYFELHEATALMEKGQYEEALIHLDTAVERNPTNLMAVYNQGACHFELARTSKTGKQMLFHLKASEEAFLRAQSLNPDMLITYFKLGKIALTKRDYASAENYYLTALELEPDNPVLHFNLAGVYDEEQKFDDAVTHYKKAIELDDSFIYAYNNLGLIYEANRELDKAEAVYRKALQINRKYNYARLNLGNLYAEQGRFREAKRLYRKALQYEPDNSWAHLYLGNIYFQNDDHENAASAYQSSIERNPEYATTYYLHAVCLNKLERYDEALISSLKYINLAPNGRYSREVLALIMALKLQQAEAEEK